MISDTLRERHYSFGLRTLVAVLHLALEKFMIGEVREPAVFIAFACNRRIEMRRERWLKP